MSKSEMIDVLNESGEIVETMTREQAEQDNHLTQNVLVFVFNAVGKVWIQLRPIDKKHYPGLWDISACGGIKSGEPEDDAAMRETLEETGLKLSLERVKSFLNVFTGDDGVTRRRLSHLYIGESEEIPKLNPEVDEFRLCEVKVLRQEVSSNPRLYVPSFLIELNIASKAHSANQR
jgi:isopentenyl-diphosphate Delta-isomerase